MYYCVVNPSAKSGTGMKLWKTFEKKFQNRNIAYQVIYTNGPGHALSFVKKLTECVDTAELPLRIVVLGGDGTLNEVISGICDFDQIMLGYLPVGSSNDFARDIDLPSDPEVIMDRILDGREVRRMDIGKLHYDSKTHTLSRLHDHVRSDTRMFDVSAGIGFDAAVCEQALASGTKNFLNLIGLGKMTYGAIAIHQLIHADKIACDIELDHSQVIHFDHFLFAAIMVHKFEGGGFRFSPDADASDGLFDLCVIGDMPLFKMFAALPLAYIGKHYGIKGVYHYRAQHVKIHTMLPLWVHTDGEVSMKSDCISLDCLPRKLILMM